MNKFKYLIYKATLKGTGRHYIGRTKNLTKRIQKHRADSKRSKTHFALAIKKYGIENFEWTELALCETWEISGKIETYFIKLFDSYKNGFNSTLGNDGISGHPGYWKGKKRDPSVIKKLHEGKRRYEQQFEIHPNTGSKHSEETRKKLSAEMNRRYLFGWAPRKGKKHSENTKKIMSLKARQRLPNNQKQIIDSMGQIYSSVKDAAQKNNIKRSTLHARLSGQNSQNTFLIKFFYVKEV